MARIRSIHPGIASDEAYMMMSMAAKAAWPVLWTECDDHGVFEWKPVVLKARIFPADNVDFGVILQEWVTLNAVRCFEHEGKTYGIVRNFCAYQRPKNPSYRYPFPEAVRQFAGVKDVESPSPPPALPQPSPSPPENPSQMKEEGGRMEVDASASTERAGVLPASDEKSPEIDLRRRIVKAYEPDLPPDTHYVAVWLGMGLDPSICAGVVEASCQRGRKPKTLKYFDDQIREAQQKRAQAPPIQNNNTPWELLVQRFTQGKGWPAQAGPSPDRDGCRCPAEILAQYEHHWRPAA